MTHDRFERHHGVSVVSDFKLSVPPMSPHLSDHSDQCDERAPRTLGVLETVILSLHVI
jgi:hypothetical protein